MPYEIVRNDVTKMEVDAIVNTANPYPTVGAGTDTAIHEAAGPELLEARKKIGDIPVGRSAATPAFHLPAKYVLHTVSPVWMDGKHGEEALLRKAYDSALNLALKLKCKSVAFPLMAAGSYGFPRDKALLVAVNAISEFALRHRMQIYLVLFNAEAFDLAGGLFSDLKSYVDDHYVEERTQSEYHPRHILNEWKYLNNRNFRTAYDPAAEVPAPPAEEAEEEAEEPLLLGAELDELMRQNIPGFREHLIKLLDASGEKDPVIYHRASISRQLFNKILNKKNCLPSKTTVLQLAIGLRLSVKETKRLLEKAGYALNLSDKRDLVVRYYIENKTYSVPLINDSLYDYGLPLLRIT
ncbi:MAG: macro domain-containing protein [Oscillibacter sp.]|nr:macro domain-containing protein [Oscillibacter sp.]